MNKSGHFPLFPWPYDSQGLTIFKRRNDTWERIESDEDESKTIVSNVVNSIILQKFETASENLENFLGAVCVTTSGKPNPAPPGINQEWVSIKENNKPFKKRVSNDEIVVSNYMIGANYYSFSNGGKISGVGSKYMIPHSISLAYFVHGMYSVIDIGNYTNCLVIDANTAIYGSIGFYRQPHTISDDRTVYDNGFTTIRRDFFPDQFEVLSHLVTKVTSDANTGSVDILTAMAELPEALSSILNACKTMIRLYTACKKRELRLQNRAKNVKLSYDEAVSQFSKLAEVIENGPGSKRFKRRRLRVIAKQRLQLKRQLKLNLREITDAIASVWLNYRYNITPNVLLIKGALDAVDKADKLFARWASTEISYLSLPEGFEGSVEVLHRCQIKRLFNSVDIGNFLSFNPFLTAWELIPLSFTVDWFINVGNAIAAITGTPSGIAQEGATYSWKVSGTISKTYADGSSVTVKVKGYKRIVIDPSLYCRLSWNPDFSPVRQLDALALSWNIALKRLIRN